MDSGTDQNIPHILLLEDDTAHQDLILRAFRDSPDKFRLSVTGTIRDARQILERDPPDLIIADWHLPDGKGLDILPRTDGRVTIPLVITTSHGDEHLAVEIMKSGAIDYVVKSATAFRDLPRIARRALRYWENLRQRQQAEEAVQESRKRLTDVLAFLPDAVLAIDNEGRVIAWNRAIEAMTGVTAADMLGKGDHEYSLPFYGERRPILIDLVLADDPVTEREYLYIRHDDGNVITAETHIPSLAGGRGAMLWGIASPLFDSAGNRIGAIEAIRDITEKKQGEELLRRREAMLETLLNAPHDTIALLDRQGIIVRINAEGARRLGGPVASITGQCVYDLLPKELAASRKVQIDRVFETGEPARFDDERSGLSLHNEIYPVFNADHTGVEHIAIFASDITEKRKTRLALERSEERFRHISGLISDFAYSCTRPEGGAYAIDWISGAVEQITGFSEAEVIALGCWRGIVIAEDRPIFDEKISGLLPGMSSRCELRIRKKDGEVRWLACFAECMSDTGPASGHRLFGGCQDITGRKEADAIRKEYETRLNSAMEIGSLAWWEMDLPGGEVRFDDRKASLLGYAPEKFRHYADFTALLHPDDFEPAMQAMRDHLEGRDPRYHADYRILTAAGTYRWFRDVGGITNRHPDGSPATVTGIVIDITASKAAEEQLRDSEMKFRDIFNNVNDGVQIHEMDADGLPGRLIEVNDVACRMLGYTRDEMLTKSPLEFVTGNHNRPLAEIGTELRTEGHATFETSHRRKDGTIIAVEINAHVTTLLGKELVVSVVRDITGRKRAEDAIRESETRFRALIQNSSDIIRVLDQDGRIIYESASSSRILGYPPGYLIGRNPLENVHPEDIGRVKSDLQEVLDRKNLGIPTEFRIRKADGEYIWVDAIGTNLLDVPGVNGIVITTRPIQQRKMAEQARRDSDERLRLALEGAGAVSWDWQIPSGSMAFSDRFYTMLGYEPGEFPPTYDGWTALMHPDERDHVLADLSDQIRRKRPLCEIEYRLRTKEGDWIWTLGRGKIVDFDDRGNPVRLVGVNIDITNRRLMESEIRSLNTVLEQRVKDRTEELARANEALEEENAQRLAADAKLRSSLEEKTVLLKEIHHRVKNNLQIIASLLNLQARYIKDESTLAAIRESQNRVKAMALVHEKLYKAEDISHIDLSEYLRFLGAGLFQFYDARSRGIRFTLEIHDVAVDINSAIPLGLIVNELISNSLKYAFPEGKTGEIAISVKKEAHTLTIVFADTGIGMPDGLDWKNTRSLGLRLVISLVDQMSGTIELDRSAGTRFTMVLHEKE